MLYLPKAILFDLDDTILFFGYRQEILTSIAAEHRDRFGAISPEEAGRIIEEAFVEFWADPVKHQAWRFSLLDARILIVKATFEQLRGRVPDLTPEFADQFARQFHERRELGASFFPGARETLDALMESGVKLALVTNGNSITQRKKVEKFDLARRFHHIQIEEEVGFGKPDPRSYRLAMGTLGVAPEDTWMVGDNLDWEVVAPQKLGIYSIWHDYRGRGLPLGSTASPDRIIRMIADLIQSDAVSTCA